ncbi:hypothetical protein BB560_005855 [Smittium megazygosporum]|uniref:Uncharacterized protein n=1 Tax=Smittium megazygosporum TaxID=133381 RepID=A0A2T9YT58_9FUNG|nr:hypothetical protein BB560_005855 [Smittium megazygosporum]
MDLIEEPLNNYISRTFSRRSHRPLNILISNAIFEIPLFLDFIIKHTIMGLYVSGINTVEDVLNTRSAEAGVETLDENETTEQFPTAYSHLDKPPSRAYMYFRTPEDRNTASKETSNIGNVNLGTVINTKKSKLLLMIREFKSRNQHDKIGLSFSINSQPTRGLTSGNLNDLVSPFPKRITKSELLQSRNISPGILDIKLRRLEKVSVIGATDDIQ